MAAPQYLGDSESLLDLESRITGNDRDVYRAFRDLHVEVSFVSRLFIVYRPTGLTPEGRHKDPEILTTLKVLSFYLDDLGGAEAVITDLTTGEELTIGHIPQRLFGYDLFVSIPPAMRIRWDGRLVDGIVHRSLAFPILVKARNRSDYYSFGVTQATTPNKLRQLFPSLEFQLTYI